MLKLGQALTNLGHEVQYFGMDHEDRCVGNAVQAYTQNMEFHGNFRLSWLSYPIRTIYSREARVKLRLVLNNFQPDVCHLNNFNYQLTPSILMEIRRWEKQSGHSVKIVYTAHDYQLVCPNHLMRNLNTETNCEQCLGGSFFSCTKGRCIHGSIIRSLIGTLEASFWNRKGTYRELDTIICPSRFLKEKLDYNPVLAARTMVILNFMDTVPRKDSPKKDYVLYFGRYSQEKGIRTLLQVCRNLPHISFLFAGSGPLEAELAGIPNLHNVGFQTGASLEQLIREARFSIYPSQWYENCPFSVLESQMYGTPVLGADIGGIPELIDVGRTGELFESGNPKDLQEKIQQMWNDRALTDRYAENCRDLPFASVEQYSRILVEQIYRN